MPSLGDQLRDWHQGAEAVARGDWGCALRLFSGVPEPRARMCFNMGCVHLLAGDPEAALRAFDEAVTKDACMAVGFFQRGVANFQLERFQQALCDFRLALAQLRGNASIDYTQLGLRFKLQAWEVLFNVAAVQCGLGLWAEATHSLEEAISKGPEGARDDLDTALDQVQKQALMQPRRVPRGEVFRPHRRHLEHLEPVDFLGKAKVVTSSVHDNQHKSSGPQQPQVQDADGEARPGAAPRLKLAGALGAKEGVSSPYLSLPTSPFVQSLGAHSVHAPGGRALCLPPIEFPLRPQRGAETKGRHGSGQHRGLEPEHPGRVQAKLWSDTSSPSGTTRPGPTGGATPTGGAQGCTGCGDTEQAPNPGPCSTLPSSPRSGLLSGPPFMEALGPEEVAQAGCVREEQPLRMRVPPPLRAHDTGLCRAGTPRGSRPPPDADTEVGSGQVGQADHRAPVTYDEWRPPVEQVGKQVPPGLLAAGRPGPSPSEDPTGAEGVAAEDAEALATITVQCAFTLALKAPRGVDVSSLRALLSQALPHQAQYGQLSYRDPSDDGHWVPLLGEEALQRAWRDAAGGPGGLRLQCRGVGRRPVLYQVVAQHSYSAQGPEDLDLQQGDTVDVLCEVDQAWLEGHCDGRIGIFPKCFVVPAGGCL